ncbi:WYL domain-containing protein [Nodosilinea sp. LEGE 07298]|uniref:helix-turn-helix transcriptional regulator n=1 Tax=Nodosilinea sp. LEGE 07298 TaxID=2777970 RepID=UPI00187FBBAA|nr:WYL domain-containing protein [Nodosilinea sp. LEGE 07298]MBE9111602.1 WYL domain-containing protein [Nodosilinea sp. LEGE 07298]
MADFLDEHGQSSNDIDQKVSRTIRKLRDCGFKINSAPNRPYELVESTFPVLFSPKQRESLALAAYVLSDMGFSAQASDLLNLGKLSTPVEPSQVKVAFSPPVDYSETRLEETVKQLQDRFQQECRYVIKYRSSAGNARNWDCDRSELRFHNGLLYLFAHVPDFSPRYSDKRPSIEQNQIFRVDRILKIYPASTTHWSRLYFPTEKISYRMSGPLAYYQPRRANEVELYRDPDNQFVDIETTEDHWFWFRQRILQYGRNVRILEPQWMADHIQEEYEQALKTYEKHPDP